VGLLVSQGHQSIHKPGKNKGERKDRERTEKGQRKKAEKEVSVRGTTSCVVV
jgi:hypothetical protein